MANEHEGKGKVIATFERDGEKYSVIRSYGVAIESVFFGSTHTYFPTVEDCEEYLINKLANQPIVEDFEPFNYRMTGAHYFTVKEAPENENLDET